MTAGTDSKGIGMIARPNFGSSSRIAAAVALALLSPGCPTNEDDADNGSTETTWPGLGADLNECFETQIPAKITVQKGEVVRELKGFLVPLKGQGEFLVAHSCHNSRSGQQIMAELEYSVRLTDSTKPGQVEVRSATGLFVVEYEPAEKLGESWSGYFDKDGETDLDDDEREYWTEEATFELFSFNDETGELHGRGRMAGILASPYRELEPTEEGTISIEVEF